MSQFCAPGDKVMLMAAQNKSRTYANAARSGKIALTFMGAKQSGFHHSGDGARVQGKHEVQP